MKKVASAKWLVLFLCRFLQKMKVNE